MNNNYITNDADFEMFVNSTLNYDSNNNNRSPTQDGYDLQITSILANHKNQLKFTRLFAYYFINRAAINDYTYSSTCCVCMDTNNYCIKICDCMEVKYCYKCFKEYVKTSILADPVKINSIINGWRSREQKLDIANIVSCSICHKSNVLGLMENIIEKTLRSMSSHEREIGNYLLSLDFFSETVPNQGDFKWYILFNKDGRVRYNLVQLERLCYLPDKNNDTSNTSNADVEDDETRLRKAGFIYIFEILSPSTKEHQQIKAILNRGINHLTEKTKQALQQFNPSRLKLL
jgi:hypothetical protein